MLSWPMIAFGWVTNMLQRGMASWKRMLEVLDDRAGDRRRRRYRSELPTPSQPFAGEIEFRDLRSATAAAPVLEHVSRDHRRRPDGRARRRRPAPASRR